MRLVEEYQYNNIKAYRLGWSLVGPPMMTVYCYVFGDVMMDTAQSHMRKEALEIAGRHPVRQVYLTHYHEDHSGNAAAIKQKFHTQTFGHPVTKKKMAAPFKILPYQTYMWGKATPLEIDIVSRKIETGLGEMTPVHTPGHSKDHLSYFLKDAGILFSGDLYLAERIKYFRADEDIGEQIASLKRILELDFEMLLCSHHPKRKNGKKYIQGKLDFLEELYGNIIMLWEQGVPERRIFHSLGLKEDYFAKYFCFANVSMINGVRSAIRFYEAHRKPK